MSYSSRFPTAIPVDPLPYPLVQQPMVLRPNRPPLGSWTPSDFDDDDIEGILPLPTTKMVLSFAIFGATIAAVSGRSTTKQLLLGASSGVLVAMGIFAVTGRW